jgi:hypothetical protein
VLLNPAGLLNTGLSCRASTLAPRAVSFNPLFGGGAYPHRLNVPRPSCFSPHSAHSPL